MLRQVDRTTLKAIPGFDDHHAIYSVAAPHAKLKAYIAIHDVTLGPALGGCRMWPYADERRALTDVLRLSRGMTYKNALANLDLGGGKAVILGDSRTQKTKDMFAALGEAIAMLDGLYITAEDVGVTTEDMDLVGTRTEHVRGTARTGLGDPSPFTALGVFHGILAAAEHRLGTSNLDGVTVSVQGLGSVGFKVAEHLSRAGANLIVSDIHKPAVDKAIKELGATAMEPDAAHAIQADIFTPCALGAGLNAQTIPEIKASIVAGAANNQLAEPEDARRLMDRNILFAPDYALNAGGVIAIALAKPGKPSPKVVAHVEAIGATLASIFARAAAERVPTAVLADQLAEERLAAARARTAA